MSKQSKHTMQVRIVIPEDLTRADLRRCMKVAVAHAGCSQEQLIFTQFMANPAFRKERELIHKEKKAGGSSNG